MARGRRQVSDWSSDENPQHSDHVVYKIGLYGWRKRCLYCLVLVMLVTVIINLALTVWILRILDFNIHGMGLVRITERGIRVDGESEFVNPVHVKAIVSREEEALLIESSKNVSISSLTPGGSGDNRLVIGNEVMDAICKKFSVQNQDGKELFAVDEKEISVGVETLTVQGDGGARFDGSIQTPVIRSEPFNSLRVESSTQSVRVEGVNGVHVQAAAGDVRVTCRDDVTLRSTKGKVHLDSEDIRVANLAQSNPTGPGRTHNGVFQVCVCQNGRLFMAPPRQPCAATDDICEE